MELKQLQFFVVSADMGSFKKAAEVLYTTQPHVSKIIKTLETELQADLFSRNAVGVELTEEGKKVYTQASAILQKMDIIRNVGGESPRQKLYISSVPNSRLAEIFSMFCQTKRGGDLQYQFLEATVEEIMGHMHHHTSEIGFVFISQRQQAGFIHQLEHKKLEFIPIKKTKPCLLVGKNSPLYGLSSVDPSVLQTVKLVRTKEDFYSISVHPGHLKEEFSVGHGGQTIVCTNSSSVVMSLLEHTDMGTISCDLLAGKFERYKLRAISLTDVEDSIQFGYIKRKRDSLSPVAEQFIDYLRKILK